MASRYEVCLVDELPPGESKVVEVEERPYSVGVFNVDGEYYALANVCPHQLAPLCEGTVTGEVVAESVGDFRTVRDGEVIQCPWHGWKFNIADGSSVFNPHEISIPTHEATAEKRKKDEIEEYGTELQGEEPPVDTYDVEVEAEVVVVYVG